MKLKRHTPRDEQFRLQEFIPDRLPNLHKGPRKLMSAAEGFAAGKQRNLKTNPQEGLLAYSSQWGPAAVLGAQEPVHQHGPPEREMELDVLLKVRTQLVTVQVVAEGEALPRDEHVYLTPHRRRQEGFQTICQEQKRGESPSARRPCAAPVPSLGMEAMPAPPGTRTTAQERAWGAARASSERQGSAPRGSVQRLYTC